MPSYDPPKDIPKCIIQAYPETINNLKLIGPNGSNFKRISEMLNLKYLWLDINSNTIEIFGNEKKQQKAIKYFTKYLPTFYAKNCINKLEPVTKKQRII